MNTFASTVFYLHTHEAILLKVGYKKTASWRRPYELRTRTLVASSPLFMLITPRSLLPLSSTVVSRTTMF